MHVGIFTETFLPQVNGAVVSICNINKELIKRGHKVTVFSVGDGHEKIDGYEVYRFHGWEVKGYPEYKYMAPRHYAWKIMKDKDVDIIHSRTAFPMGVVAKRLAQRTGKSIIGTFDTPITDYVHYVKPIGSVQPTKYILEGIARKWMKKYYGWCDIVTAPSETTKQKLLSWGFKDNIEVVSNGIDTKKFNPKNYDKKLKGKLCPNGGKLILHVGRITKEKKVSELLKISKILGDKKMKFKMLIVGGGPELENIKMKTKSLGLEKKIVFPGYISQKDLPKYYASADVFLTASTVETQGLVLLEALASGLPVVGAAAEAIPELIKDGKNGFLFEPDKPEKAAEFVENLLRDENLRKNLSKNTVKYVKRHSIESVCTEWERIYKKVVDTTTLSTSVSRDLSIYPLSLTKSL